MRIPLLLIALLVLGMASCRSGKLQKKGIDLGKSASESTLTAADLAIAEPEFTQLRLRSDADISSAALMQRFPVTFHIQKDSMIWASVSVGLEVGRAKITKDSLFFLDRFNRKAYIGTWEELSRASGFELNYGIVQSLLTGGMLFSPTADDRLSAEAGGSLLRQVRRGIVFESRIDNTAQKIFEVTGQDLSSDAKLTLHFSRFIAEREQLIPSVIRMVLTGKSNATLQITHSRIELDGQNLSFSFSIPGSYKVVPLPGI